jgi:polysaccharide biosynthesis protein PelA
MILVFWGPGSADAQPTVPRTIITFYDSKENPDIRLTRTHRYVEMPLNHLGLKFKFLDINRPLPPLKDLGDVRGVFTWFESDRMPNPLEFLSWADRLMDKKIKWVIFGNLGIQADTRGKKTPMPLVNRYLSRLGLRTQESWKQVTYDVKLVYHNKKMVGFERPYAGILPPFPQVYRLDETTTAILSANWGKDLAGKSDLIVIGPQGGYAAPGYSILDREDFHQWYLDPFEFFRQAFATDDLPKPDTTTLSGRRMYYSHIDGDGWRNITEIEDYHDTRELSAEVVFLEALKPFPDLPVTLAPIAGDLDPTWYGTEEILEQARKMLALPQVEAGSHTYSHPYFWNYYKDYRAEKEWGQFLAKKEKPDSPIAKRFAPFLSVKSIESGQASKNKPKKKNDPIPHMYEEPRAYLDYPFDLEQEITGSIEFINKLCPPGKKVKVLQWSGDTSPFPAALAKTREIKVLNINGGDSRFDSEFPSHSWVSPVGLQNEDQLQIYASASNENTYTELWKDKFYGFQSLITTLKNTESPRRLKPINIYYHLYSGQKAASLNALVKNLRYAQGQEIAPVTTSHYAQIAEGFYSTRFIPLGPKTWRIENRGHLQTLRFDDAARLAVDMKKSQGVIGQRHFQGSLYVSLDTTRKEPVLALKDFSPEEKWPTATHPYLVEGRWHIWNLEFPRKQQTTFSAQGFGDGEMVWKVPNPGQYELILSNDAGVQQTVNAVADEDGILKIKFGPKAIDNVTITLTQVHSTL